MLVRFTNAVGVDRGPVYIDADSIRLLVVNVYAPNGGAILYQKGSDVPISVMEDVEAVAKVLQEARGVKEAQECSDQ